MTLSHTVKLDAMATPDVASTPPLEFGLGRITTTGSDSNANTFTRERRSGNLRASLWFKTLVRLKTISCLPSNIVTVTLAIILCMITTQPALSDQLHLAQETPPQEQAQEVPQHSPALTSDESGEMTDAGDIRPPAEMTDSGDIAPQSEIPHVRDVDEAALLKGQLQQEDEQSFDTLQSKRLGFFARMLPQKWQDAIIHARKNQKRRPLLAFQRWAHDRKPFVPTFLFCMFFGLVGCALFPKQIAVAQECCRSQFWSCLGKSIMIGMIVGTSYWIIDQIVIAQALATVLIALWQLALLAGLAVGVSLIGEGLTRGNIAKSAYLTTHPRLATFIKLLIGSLTLALIVQLPGAGLLPRIGIRIALLVAILGAGGLLKTKFGTEPISTD
jgi:hypothetical protein